MLQLLMMGYSNADIGRYFSISPAAVAQRITKSRGIARGIIEQVMEQRSSKIRDGLVKAIDIVYKDLSDAEYKNRADAAARMLRFANMAQQVTGRPIITGEPEQGPAIVNMQTNVAAGSGPLINLSRIVQIAEERRGGDGE